MSRYFSCGLTDPGKVRDNNEDSIFLENDGGLFVLADGMGGHKGGEVASNIAVEAIGRLLGGEDEDELEIGGMTAPPISAAIVEADRMIKETAEENPDFIGMGSTLDLLIFEGDKAYIGHVGDSRVYLCRHGEDIRGVTLDQSVYNDLVHLHGIDPKEAQKNKYALRVTNALGYLVRDRIMIYTEEKREGDLYILCSDGLTDVVADAEIAKIVGGADGDVDICARNLVDLALERGGPDNVSVIVVKVEF